MNGRAGVFHGAWLLLTLLTAACSSPMEPARRSLGEIQAALGAASPDAATYVPDRLHAVQGQLGMLEGDFDRHDYAAVLRGAPAVLRSAQELIGEAAAAKADRRRSLGDEWTALAGELPPRIEAAQRRIDAGAALRAGRDLEAAKAGLRAAEALWSKAQAAFATGNLDEAVATARRVAPKVDAAALESPAR